MEDSKWGLYWADESQSADGIKDGDFLLIEHVPEGMQDFEEVLEWGLIQCERNAWFVDGYPGSYYRNGFVSGRFIVKNFSTKEAKLLIVETEFTPSFVIMGD